MHTYVTENTTYPNETPSRSAYLKVDLVRAKISTPSGPNSWKHSIIKAKTSTLQGMFESMMFWPSSFGRIFVSFLGLGNNFLRS